MSYACSPAREPAHHTRPPPLPRVAGLTGRTTAFDADLVALLPPLKAYALSLCRNSALADDLVQAASVGAMANAHLFQAGTSMRAWLFTILRNQYFSILRKRRREIQDADGRSAETLLVEPNQDHAVDLQDTMRAMRRLPPIHSELLVSLGSDGLTYDDAAQTSGCAVGTIKSRANRARKRLAQTMAELEGSSGSTDMKVRALC